MLSACIKNEPFPASAALEERSIQFPQQPLVPQPLSPLPEAREVPRAGGPPASRDLEPWGSGVLLPSQLMVEKATWGLWGGAGSPQAFQGAGCSCASSQGHILTEPPWLWGC